MQKGAGQYPGIKSGIVSACSYHGFMGGPRTKNVKSDESTLNIVDLFDHTVPDEN